VLYFLLHNAETFHSRLAPTLAESWRQRSFAPIVTLAADLAAVFNTFAERYHLTADEAPLLRQLTAEQPFDRRLWRHLAGELLLYAAADAPAFQTASDTLTSLLAPESAAAGKTARTNLAPIQQVHFGSRDLDFGGVVYRPHQAGLNDVNDVARLAAYLAAVDAARWTAADLRSLPGLTDDEEWDEELAFARDSFADLRAMYEQARERGQVVVCEEV
jgi:hypothetical protein